MILICGGPRTGKSTLAEVLKTRFNLPIVHCDDYLSLGRNTMLLACAADCADYTYPIIEGCEAPRLLTIGLKPEVILWLGPTNPVKYLERYHFLIRSQLDALDGHPVTVLPRKPSFADVAPHLPPALTPRTETT